MCGIAGIVGRLASPAADQGSVRRMLESIRHRGPDGEGVVTLEGAILGHRRLSIIDLAGGKQPMSNEDGTVWVSFNGEIYSFGTLRKELISLGHAFATRSDTEVIVHAYEQWDDSFIERLHGMFGFALWDAHRRRLVLARDRMGIKPLYYAIVDEALVFASELKAFREVEGLGLRLDVDAVDRFLALRYVPGPSTMLCGVRKLRPGERLVWRGGRVALDEYWRPGDLGGFAGSEGEGRDLLHAVVRSSIESHLVADVPVGVFLSGGLDSSIVASQLKKLNYGRTKAFSVCLDLPGGADERPWAEFVARESGMEFVPLAVGASEYLSGLEAYAWLCDDLVADSASYLLHELSGLARQHVKVVLSGEGADELFAGYGYEAVVRVWRRQEWINKLPPGLSRVLLATVRGTVGWSRVEAHLRNHRASLRDWVSEMREPHGMGFDPASRNALYSAESGLRALSVREITRAAVAEVNSDDLLDYLLQQDTRIWLPDNLLCRADRMTMAHGLELRVPFLDDSVVALANSFPAHWKLRYSQGKWLRKWILRSAFAQDVPAAVLHRPKMGFTTDFHRLFNGVGMLRAREILRYGRLRDEGIFKHGALDELTRDMGATSVSTAQRVFSMMLLFLWYERMFAPRVI